MKHDYSKFVRYEKRETMPSGDVIISYIEGLQYQKKYIYSHIDFNTFSEEETKIPNNYKKKGISKKWITEFKCDNTKTMLSKNNQMFKKISMLHSKYKKYFILNEGKTSYVVYVSKKNQISIYKKSDKYYVNKQSTKSANNLWMYTQLVSYYNCLKVFIGKNSTKTSGSKFNGNSILVKIEKDTYVFIGHEIYTFSLRCGDHIVNYYSPVRNNKVPYPVAVGKKCLYFMLDKTYISISSINNFNSIQDKENLYSYYYGRHNNEPWEKKAKKFKVKI
jgi:hypothetical protein